MQDLTLNSPAASRGITLVEALVALAVMAFGMLALVKLTHGLERSSELARQRGEALRLARSDIAQLRDFSVLSPAPQQRAYADIQSLADSPISLAGSNTEYRLSRQVAAVLDQDAAQTELGKDVQVQVSWTDRVGQEQSVQLVSWIARADPAFSGALTLAPPAEFARPPLERHAAIPRAAKDVDDHRSAFKPSPGGSTAWVFDRSSGLIVQTCKVDAKLLNAALSLGALQGCASVQAGYFLGGSVAFSYGALAQAAKPDSVPLAVHPVIELTSSGHPSPAYECFDDAGVAAKALSYFCIVYGNAAQPSSWTGTVKLAGLDLGNQAAQFRVCRYSADYDLDAKESNDEHPLVHSEVSHSLARQNFLVVRGSVGCPTAPAVDPAAGVFVDYGTKEVQPSPVK